MTWDELFMCLVDLEIEACSAFEDHAREYDTLEEALRSLPLTTKTPDGFDDQCGDGTVWGVRWWARYVVRLQVRFPASAERVQPIPLTEGEIGNILGAARARFGNEGVLQ